MSKEKSIDFSEKFKDIMGEESLYEFFLKMQNIMPKFSKKNDKEYFSFITFALGHLSKYDEKESIQTLLNLSMKLYLEKYKDFKIPEPMTFMKTFHNILKKLPVNVDKSFVKFKFLELCEKNGIPDEELSKENIYYEFAIDSIENKFLIEGYRFSMKSMNLEAINSAVNSILKRDKMENYEKNVFVARTCLEIIINKNIKMANDFIIPFVNARDDYEENDPIINFAYFICQILKDEKASFEKFKELCDIYKPYIEKKEAILKKYINRISNDIFKKLVFLETNNIFGGFNFMNMMRLVSSLAGGH